MQIKMSLFTCERALEKLRREESKGESRIDDIVCETCALVCVFANVCVCVSMCVCVYVCVSIHDIVCETCALVCVFVCVCQCVCVCVCVRVSATTTLCARRVGWCVCLFKVLLYILPMHSNDTSPLTLRLVIFLRAMMSTLSSSATPAHQGIT